MMGSILKRRTLFLELPQHRLVRRAVVGMQMIDEEDTVQVVVLMLGGTGEKTLGLDLKGFSTEILADDADTGGSFHLVMESRHAEASLRFRALLIADGMDLGIDHHQRHEGVEFDLAASDPGATGSAVLSRENIDHGHLDGAPDLMGGQSHALLLVHGDDHRLGQFDKRLVDLLDPAALAAKGGVTVFDHLERFRIRFGGFTAANFPTGLATAGMFLMPAD